MWQLFSEYDPAGTITGLVCQLAGYDRSVNQGLGGYTTCFEFVSHHVYKSVL